MRMAGLPMLNLWSQVLKTLSEEPLEDCKVSVKDTFQAYWGMHSESVDYVPASLPIHYKNTRLIMVKDNDAVIKSLQKGMAPAMMHVARTHRVNLDWLLERSFEDTCILSLYRRESTIGRHSQEATIQCCRLVQFVPAVSSQQAASQEQDRRDKS